MKKDKEWFSISEAASYLGVSPDSLRRWEKAGKIPPPQRTIGNARRYPKEMLKGILGGKIKASTSEDSQKIRKTEKKVPIQKFLSELKLTLIIILATLATLGITIPLLLLSD